MKLMQRWKGCFPNIPSVARDLYSNENTCAQVLSLFLPMMQPHQLWEKRDLYVDLLFEKSHAVDPNRLVPKSILWNEDRTARLRCVAARFRYAGPESARSAPQPRRRLEQSTGNEA